MKPRLDIIIAILLVSQVSYYAAFSVINPLDSTAIIVTIAFLVGSFSLFYAGYKWARWMLLAFVVLDILGASVMLVEVGSLWFLLPVTLDLIAGYYLAVFKIRRRGESTEELATEVPGGFVMQEQVFKYPTLVKRYQSVFIDFFILFAIMIITMVSIGDAPYRQTVMITLGVVFMLAYEPVLTVYSSTIGQRIMGIRVRNVRNPNERISLLQAYLRIMVKGLLGWLSFITIHFNPQHRAIHDMAGDSVVVKVTRH